MPKRVLITGGAGFIGSYLADNLLRRGYAVRALDNLSPQVHGPNARRPDYLSRDVELVVGDVADPDAVRRALRGVDGVFHLAATVGVGQSMYELARYTRTNNLGTAELYDPATGTFSATGNVTRFYDPSIDKFFYKGEMIAARSKHSATVMRDGNVLIAGGEDAHGTAQATAEIYVAASGKFLPAGPMKFARREHRATMLPNGEVLITGGVDSQGQILATAELYNPATRTFALTTAAFPAGTNMNEGRSQHTAALLPNGQVLIAGGSGPKSTSRSAELYDPSRGSFTCVGGSGGATAMPCAGSMIEYRTSAVDVSLPNGEVLIAGGYNFHMAAAHNMLAAQGTIGGASVPFSVLWSAEVYNPASGTFVSTVSIAQSHFGPTSH